MPKSDADEDVVLHMWRRHAVSRIWVARFTRTHRELTVPLTHVRCVVEARHRHSSPLRMANHRHRSPADLLRLIME